MSIMPRIVCRTSKKISEDLSAFASLCRFFYVCPSVSARITPQAKILFKPIQMVTFPEIF